MAKEKIPPESIDTVNWEAKGTALRTIPKTRQHFITKLTTGLLRGREMDETLGQMGGRLLPMLWYTGGRGTLGHL